MSEYPIQLEKVHAPPLRDDVIERARLLDWLEASVRCRVTLVIAEAGYGKTTLLADFARRSSLPVAWYRLDRGDRDWVRFIAHLVASIRVQVPTFGASTTKLILTMGRTSQTLEVVLESLVRDLIELPAMSLVLVLDDFHAIDDSPDVVSIANELITAAAERIHFVIASRRRPRLRLARLRSAEQVATVATAELRFDSTEIGLLFEGDPWVQSHSNLLQQVGLRTEGWPASLQLVRSALRTRDSATARLFIRSLSGVTEELYEYLAEEVVGILPDELQEFLMATSVLEVITAEVASAAAELPLETTTNLLNEAERLGLVSAAIDGPTSGWRAHPLVRQFLVARLRRAIGDSALAGLHLRVAEATATTDWSGRASHYIDGGDLDRARTVLKTSLPSILATGSLHQAHDLCERAGLDEGSSTSLILRARLAQQRGDASVALALAEEALALDPSSVAAITTVMATRTFGGDASGGATAAALLDPIADARSWDAAHSYQLILETSNAGSLDSALAAIQVVIREAQSSDSRRYFGIAKVNEAHIRKAMGQPELALEAADDAIAALNTRSTAIEQVSARLVRAWALAHLGELDAAREEARRAESHVTRDQAVEVAGEVAEIEFYYGDLELARAYLGAVDDFRGDGSDQALLSAALIDGVSGDLSGALERVASLRIAGLATTVAFEARRRASASFLAALAEDPRAHELAMDAVEHARKQGSTLWANYAQLIHVSLGPSGPLSVAIVRLGNEAPAVLTMAAEALCLRLDDLSIGAAELVSSEVERRPERWRKPLRERALAVQPSVAAAQLLSRIGEAQDVSLLQAAARAARRSDFVELSRRISRRLAARVEVEDLGRVRIVVGDRTVDGSQVRRKVLGLLCLLVTRTDFSASREDVVESIWPDQDPDDGLNSLNQTVYFLRRVFEPLFREEASPGYVHQDGETIWLDTELVTARSTACRKRIAELGPYPTPAEALSVLSSYPAPFALDFAYEEWASRFREPLHAAVLRVAETALARAIDNGAFGEAISLAERAVSLEPESEQLQLSLVALYRRTGAHAAAAEQYGQYIETMTGLGIQPTPQDDIELQGLWR